MKNRVLFLMATFVGFLPVFVIQKPVFMAYHHQLASASTLTDYLKVIAHGLTLDLSIAGYLTIVPFLLVLFSVWVAGPYLKAALKGYFLLAAVVIAAIFSIDIELYSYWGFRLDTTPFFYLKTPKDALASIPLRAYFTQTVLFVLYAAAICWFFWKLIIPVLKIKPVRHRIAGSFILLLCGGILFIPIRGGLSVSTANEGRAYFSTDLFLNYAAVNPCFSLLASVWREHDFASQYQFLPENERKATFEMLTDIPTSADTLQLLNTRRPNIVLILMESFSANAIEVLGGEPGITPNLNRLSREGVLFDRFYANSFRTDRGLVSVLNGYPAQPTTSIMKYPMKSQSLPSIAKVLDSVGYRTSMTYGGDINFTNMQSYFYASGYQKITADRDFPLKDRLSKWGANDDVTFPHLLEEIKRESDSVPFFKTFLTLSSHEPFEVPFHHIDDLYLNSVAFTDSCIGSFIDSLKTLPVWSHTLVILLSDHGYLYPYGISHYDPKRQKMPMLWLGGALTSSRIISDYASQIDLAATLLAQMQLDASAFRFSKNIVNPASPKFAFYTFPNGFGFIDSTGTTAYDCESDRVLIEEPHEETHARMLKGKAMLQTLYQDLGAR
ncbi:MAG: sulfatase-like hydrolase/transferase [Parabacteroides sp.]|nr:sulfatase-like hydrolase/transferase [Parabacteroides sp.]